MAKITTSPPKLIYENALRKHYIWQEQLYTVGTCPDGLFRQFIASCSGKQHILDEVLSDLVVCDSLARWYALEQLLIHKVPVLFVE